MLSIWHQDTSIMCRAGATISASTVATAATKGRKLQGGEEVGPQYVTRGDYLRAVQSGKSIGDAISDVRRSPHLPSCHRATLSIFISRF